MVATQGQGNWASVVTKDDVVIKENEKNLTSESLHD